MERAASERPVVRRRRAPLTREKVLRAALRLANEGGIEAVSMRRLGQALKVEAMSLYKHVADKDDLLAALADLVTQEFTVPAPGDDWRTEIRESTISVHAALRRHPWAGPVLESRLQPGPTRLRYLDGVLATLAAAGFRPGDAGRAFMALDSHTYGFAMQEQAWAYDPADSRRLAAMALMLATVLANLMPDNPYFEHSLRDWRQGHFLNFNGLTRLISSLWPFLALPWLMLSRRNDEPTPP